MNQTLATKTQSREGAQSFAALCDFAFSWQEKIFFFILLFISAFAQSQKPYVSKVWVADNGDGTYKNPILNADYSDPDAIRVGDNFYLVSSSFEDIRSEE